MARKKKVEEELVNTEQPETITEVSSGPAVLKEFTQNGIRYRRIRDEKGVITDVRL